MLVDLASFSEEGFDAKKWINAASASIPPEESAEKFLTELEMKLQLLSEDIAASLEEQSAAALLRVPRAMRETTRIRDDAVTLKGTVGAILLRLDQVEGSAGQSVVTLKQIDAVKQKMEAAKSTLQDAAGLAQLSASVEEVFASGDLPRVAETLSNMRRCLAVVGEVPEFSNVKRQLAVLEERLEQMVRPQLMDAIGNRDVAAAQELRKILVAVDGFAALQQLYCRTRLRGLRRMWDEDFKAPSLDPTSQTPFSDWLPKFFDEVLLLAEQESRWLSTAFHEEHQQLLQGLIVALMDGISSSFSNRIDAAITAPQQRLGAGGFSDVSASAASKPPLNLPLLVSLHSTTATFSRNILLLFPDADSALFPRQQAPHQQPADASLGAILGAVFSPFEGYKQRYGELEKRQLAREISAVDLKPAAAGRGGQKGAELAEAVKRLELSVPSAMASLESAVDRCLSFTGGSEAEALLLSLDDALLLFLSRLFDLLDSLRPVCGLSPPAPAPSPLPLADQRQGEGGEEDAGGLDSIFGSEEAEEEEWTLVQGALQLLAVSDAFGMKAAVFEASLRASLSRVAAVLVGGGEGA